MAELPNPDSQLTAVKWRFPSVHPEGRKYLLIAGGVTLVTYFAISQFLGWLLVGLTIWVAAFFRDPVRTTPVHPKLVVSPADGLVTQIKRVPPPPELRPVLGEGEFTRVSIFMSVFDVHINRTPIAGTVRKVAYVPGKFVNADLDKASEDNERQHFVVEAPDGTQIGFTQIAGLVARRSEPSAGGRGRADLSSDDPQRHHGRGALPRPHRRSLRHRRRVGQGAALDRGGWCAGRL
jgi:phosphatidylserine decarboxylase